MRVGQTHSWGSLERKDPGKGAHAHTPNHTALPPHLPLAAVRRHVLVVLLVLLFLLQLHGGCLQRQPLLDESRDALSQCSGPAGRV